MSSVSRTFGFVPPCAVSGVLIVGFCCDPGAVAVVLVGHFRYGLGGWRDVWYLVVFEVFDENGDK